MDVKALKKINAWVEVKGWGIFGAGWVLQVTRIKINGQSPACCL